MIEFLPECQGNVVAVRASGQLTHEDYEQFRPRVEEAQRRHGSVRVLMELDDFHGWTVGAAWDDLKLGLAHLGQFERCAIVGDRAWERWMVALGKPFFDVEFFDRSQAAQAREWLRRPTLPGTPVGRPWLEDLAGMVRRHPVAAVLIGLGLLALVAEAGRHRGLRSFPT